MLHNANNKNLLKLTFNTLFTFDDDFKRLSFIVSIPLKNNENSLLNIFTLKQK